MGKKIIYLICPVRNCSPEVKARMDYYVKYLEDIQGHKVHYPPRDLDQTDKNGIDILTTHCSAMMGVDEVHIWWDKDSSGSKFDLGMALMCRSAWRADLRFVLANPDEVKETEGKSWENVVLTLCGEKRNG